MTTPLSGLRGSGVAPRRVDRAGPDTRWNTTKTITLGGVGRNAQIHSCLWGVNVTDNDNGPAER